MKKCKHHLIEIDEPGYDGLYCEFCGMSEDQITIQTLIKSNQLDIRPIIAVTMRVCGLTYREIGEILGLSKQAIDKMIQKYK